MTPQPFLVSGDINRAEISYAGDLGAADAIARDHCAQYARVARYVGSGLDHAYYECDLH